MSMQQVKFSKRDHGLMMYSSDNPQAGGRYGAVLYSDWPWSGTNKHWSVVRFHNWNKQGETLYFSKRRHAKKALQKWGQPQ